MKGTGMAGGWGGGVAWNMIHPFTDEETEAQRG